MSKLINLGKTDEQALLKVDLTSLVDSRMLIQGNSGGGKSWLLRLLCERATAHIPIIVLDPEGEFASLREKLDLVLVGNDGEIAADLRSAALLASKLVELRVSAVIDLYELKPHQRREYVKLFLEALVELPRPLWHSTLICLDEAHKFAPEKGTGEAVSTQAVIDLMSLGRKRGFAGILATQRFSKLHNDAIAECNNVCIGRTWLDADQKRAGEYLGMAAADRRKLRELDKGEFYAFGPALSVGGVSRFRSDLVETTHPKPGERYKLKPPKASEAIRHIVSQLEGLPEQAEEEARTVGALQAQLREAHKTITRLEREQPKPAPPVRIEVPVIADAQIKQLRGLVAEVSDVLVQADSLGRQLTDGVSELNGSVTELLRRKEQTALAGAFRRPIPTRPPGDTEKPPKRTEAAGDAGGQLSGPQQRMVDALASFHSLGLATVNKAHVAVFSNQSSKSSGFRANVTALSSNGYVERFGGDLRLTDKGLNAAATVEDIVTLDQLHRAWLDKLSTPQRAMLSALLKIYPQGIDKEQLAGATGQSPLSSGYRANLTKLSSLSLLERRTGGEVAAGKLLFPEGLN